MCGRFSLSVPPDVLEARFDAEATAHVAPRHNIAPGQPVAAIRDDAPAEIDQLEWGLLPGWVDDPDGYPSPINARVETLPEKASFRDAFAKRRCLVLADGFYEWQGRRGRKRPYRVERADGEPFAFAGLWETWSPPSGATDDARRTTTIVTTGANDVVSPIHDRMPVMLEPGEERRWLAEDDPAELQSLLDPYPDGLVRAYEVSTRVNDPANDSAAVAEPLDHGQSGLGEFG